MLHGGHPSWKRPGDCPEGKGCDSPCGRHCKRKDMIEAGNHWDESPSLRESREKTDHKRREYLMAQVSRIVLLGLKGSGRSLRGADMAEVYADDPVWVYQRFFCHESLRRCAHG